MFVAEASALVFTLYAVREDSNSIFPIAATAGTIY